MPCRRPDTIVRRLSLLALALACVLAVPMRTGAAQAGAPSRPATGVVEDEGGGAIPRALVRLVNAGGREVRSTLTDDSGRFTIDVRGCDGCRVEASLAGFTPASAAPGGQPLRLVLAVAPIRDSVVVAATRDTAPASQIGAVTTVLGGREIERRGAPVLSEVLRGVPGLAVVQTGGYGGITSVFTRGGESSYNKVLIDGIPINEPGGTFNFGNLTTGHLERVEIVRGAQSALFGSDAMSSVIQLVSKRGAAGRARGALMFEGGGYGTGRGSAELSGATGRLDYSLHAGRYETDNRAENNRFENATAAWNMGAALGDGLTLRTVGRTEWMRAGTPGQTAFGRPDRDAFFDRRDTLAGLTLSRERGAFKDRATYAFARSRQTSTNLVADPPYTPQFGGNVGPFTFFDFTYDSRNTLDRHRVSYQADWRLGPFGRLAPVQFLTAALDWDGERATLANRLAGSTVRASRNNTGVSLQHQAVSSRISVVTGVRVEDNASFGTVAVPRVSVAAFLRHGHGAMGRTTARFNAGLGVKEPTILQSFSANPFFLGNPDLEPERARALDAGIEQRLLHDRVKVEAVFFDNRYRNKIATRTTNFTTFAAQYFNIGRTDARGLELAAEVVPVPAIHVRGGYTFTDSEIVESTSAFSPVFAVGQWAFWRPRHGGFLQAAWTHRSVTIDVTGTFVGRRTDSDFGALGTPILSSGRYAVWAAAGHYRPNGRLDLFVRVSNLTDRSYMEPLGYPAWRRTAHAGVRVGF